jgi:hypothetical protein
VRKRGGAELALRFAGGNGGVCVAAAGADGGDLLAAVVLALAFLAAGGFARPVLGVPLLVAPVGAAFFGFDFVIVPPPLREVLTFRRFQKKYESSSLSASEMTSAKAKIITVPPSRQKYNDIWCPVRSFMFTSVPIPPATLASVFIDAPLRGDRITGIEVLARRAEYSGITCVP